MPALYIAIIGIAIIARIQHIAILDITITVMNFEFKKNIGAHMNKKIVALSIHQYDRHDDATCQAIYTRQH